MDDIYKGPGVEDLGSSPTDNLFAGENPAPTAAVVTIATGQVLERGAVLGRVTASDEFVLSAAAAADGSQNPRVILMEGVDTTGGAADAPVYLTGPFNRNVLILGAGHTLDSIYWPLADVGIQLRDTVRG